MTTIEHTTNRQYDFLIEGDSGKKSTGSSSCFELHSFKTSVFIGLFDKSLYSNKVFINNRKFRNSILYIYGMISRGLGISISLLLLLLSLTLYVNGQNNTVPVPTIPKPSMIPPSSGGYSQPQQQPPVNPSQRGQQQMQQHNDRVRQEQARQRQLQRVLEEDRREAEERAATMRSHPPRIQYDFPNRVNVSGMQSYRKAFDDLLSQKEDFSISKAVFTTENAYFDNIHSYDYLKKGLVQTAQYLKNAMVKKGQDTTNNVALNLMIYQFFADTMVYEDGSLHLPYVYDFEDFRGKEDHRKTMVYKLLGQNTGQCHSLPLLYLMIAEFMGAEAYLVNAPMHTYIKFPLPNGGFQNIELTNHFFNTDAHVIASGFVKAEALQSKIYMQPLSEKQLLSDNIADLAKGFTNRFGYTPFVMTMIDSSLAIDSTNVVAWMLKSNYLTLQFMMVERQLGVTQENFQTVLPRFPKAVAILNARNAIYDKIDAMGFEEMPEQAYTNWLNDMKEEKEKRDSKQNFLKLKRLSE